MFLGSFNNLLTLCLSQQRPKFLRSRVNYQAINADTLRAQNMESFPTFNQVSSSYAQRFYA